LSAREGVAERDQICGATLPSAKGLNSDTSFGVIASGFIM